MPDRVPHVLPALMETKTKSLSKLWAIPGTAQIGDALGRAPHGCDWLESKMASEEARGSKVPAEVDEFEVKMGIGFAWKGDPAAALTKLLGLQTEQGTVRSVSASPGTALG